jgi:curved DNA-binding protein CbpA
MAESHYDVLGVPPGASSQEIKGAYRALSKRLHPDRGGSAEAFARLTAAAETLLDEARRADYDRRLGLRAGPAAKYAAPWTEMGWRDAPTKTVACPDCGAPNQVQDSPRVRAAECTACGGVILL